MTKKRIKNFQNKYVYLKYKHFYGGIGKRESFLDIDEKNRMYLYSNIKDKNNKFNCAFNINKKKRNFKNSIN